MAEQLKVEDVNEAKDAFIEDGQINKNKLCSIIKSLGHNEETVVNSTNEIFDFKDFAAVMEQLNTETGANEITESFLNNGYITRQNILTFINSRSNIVKEAEIQAIIGNRKVSKYSYNSFVSIMTCVHMREVFEKFDKDGSGYITPHELMNFLESNSGKMYSFLDVTQKMKTVDLNGDGKINFEEFVRMMIHDANSIEDKMREAFRVYDIDGDGFVTREELKEVLSKVDENFNEDEIDELVETADQDGDNKINFEEFIEIVDWDN